MPLTSRGSLPGIGDTRDGSRDRRSRLARVASPRDLDFGSVPSARLLIPGPGLCQRSTPEGSAMVTLFVLSVVAASASLLTLATCSERSQLDVSSSTQEVLICPLPIPGVNIPVTFCHFTPGQNQETGEKGKYEVITTSDEGCYNGHMQLHPEDRNWTPVTGCVTGCLPNGSFCTDSSQCCTLDCHSDSTEAPPTCGGEPIPTCFGEGMPCTEREACCSGVCKRTNDLVPTSGACG